MGSKVRLEPYFFVVAAAAILLIPLRWVFAWLVAACLHELCHIFTLVLLGLPIEQITIGTDGAMIHTQAMSPVKEFLCAAAGPLGSFSLLLLARWLPYVSVCGFLQGCYNLLPVGSMDGGRLVSCLLRVCCGASAAQTVQNIIQWCVILGLFALSLCYLLSATLGPLPLILVVFLAVRSGKIPCKSCYKQVQ